MGWRWDPGSGQGGPSQARSSVSASSTGAGSVDRRGADRSGRRWPGPGRAAFGPSPATRPAFEGPQGLGEQFQRQEQSGRDRFHQPRPRQRRQPDGRHAHDDGQAPRPGLHGPPPGSGARKRALLHPVGTLILGGGPAPRGRRGRVVPRRKPPARTLAPRTPARLADGLGAEGCPVAPQSARFAPKVGSPAPPAIPRRVRRSLRRNPVPCPTIATFADARCQEDSPSSNPIHPMPPRRDPTARTRHDKVLAVDLA